jgi:hypothetical protein
MKAQLGRKQASTTIALDGLLLLLMTAEDRISVVIMAVQQRV